MDRLIFHDRLLNIVLQTNDSSTVNIKWLNWNDCCVAPKIIRKSATIINLNDSLNEKMTHRQYVYRYLHLAGVGWNELCKVRPCKSLLPRATDRTTFRLGEESVYSPSYEGRIQSIQPIWSLPREWRQDDNRPNYLKLHYICGPALASTRTPYDHTCLWVRW